MFQSSESTLYDPVPCPPDPPPDHGAPRCKWVESPGSRYGPVCALPPEVLIQIFLHVIPDENNPSTWSCDDIWTLSAVCQRWRDIVRSTPKWWSLVHFEGNRHEVWSNSCEARVELQLSLSQSQPIHAIVVEDDDALEQHDSIAQYRNALRSHLSRLSSIRFKALYYRVPHLFYAEPQDLQTFCLPTLEHLHAEFTFGRHYTGSQPGLVFEAKNVPALRRVGLVDYFGQDRVSLPWSQLTAISLDSCEPCNIVDILILLNPSIVTELELIARFVMSEFEYREEVENIQKKIVNAITFANVDRFTFGTVLAYTNEDDVDEEANRALFEIRRHLLSKLRFPVLCHLAIKRLLVRKETPMAPEEFLAPFASSLQELWLEDVTIAQRSTVSEGHNVACAYDMLEHFPNLTHVTSLGSGRVDADVTNEMGAALVGALESSPELCPRLSSLEMVPLQVAKRRIGNLIATRVSPITVPVSERMSLRRVVLEEVELYNSEDYDADEQFDKLRIGDYNDGETEVRIGRAKDS